ncbi:hypothetical protein B0H19DRAFT_947877, partial [Mycena capillaripes]
NTPNGYLFVFPTKDLQIGPSSFSWPDYPAYWSLDPAGVTRLSKDEATVLGFPALEMTTTISAYSWDASVYVGLRKFHHAKGFEPYGPEVALHLGHRLYEVFSKMRTFACGEEKSTDSVYSGCCII